MSRRTLEDRYCHIFSNWVTGIYETRVDGTYVTANPALARMFGYDSPAQMMAVITDADTGCYVVRGRRAEFVRLMQQHGAVTGFESEVIKKDRTTFWMAEDALAIRDEVGEVIGFEGTIVDVTQRRLAEDALRRSEARLLQVDQLRRELIAHVSHDLRTPLTSLQAHLETLIEAEAARPEPARRMSLDSALSQVKRLDRLIDELFSLARLEGGDVILKLEPVALCELAQDVLDPFGVDAARHGVTISTHWHEAVSVQGDIALLERLIENLVANALQHTPAGGRVFVHCVAAAGEVTMSVADTGPGIAPSDLPFIFDRYYRGASGSGRVDRRSGLGLAIAHRIVALHGSELKVACGRDGGTTFWFTLPRLQKAAT